MQSIQMKLSKKLKTCSKVFYAFSEVILNFEHFEKNMTLIGYIFQKLRTAQDVLRQMSKKSFFRRPFKRRICKRTQTLLKHGGHHLNHI